MPPDDGLRPGERRVELEARERELLEEHEEEWLEPLQRFSVDDLLAFLRTRVKHDMF
jgi:hypothetical protein